MISLTRPAGHHQTWHMMARQGSVPAGPGAGPQAPEFKFASSNFKKSIRDLFIVT